MHLRSVVALCAALLPLPAAAHVTFENQSAPAGTTYRATFRVPHGCDGNATQRVQVVLPESVTGAWPMPKPGWRLRLTPRPDQPVASGHGAAPELAEVAWEDGRLEDAHHDELVSRFRLPDRPGELLYVPVTQFCAGDTTAAWVEMPAEGRRVTDYRFPAPALRLAPRQ
jgi:uncharacterized protein YcnI